MEMETCESRKEHIQIEHHSKPKEVEAETYIETDVEIESLLLRGTNNN